MFCEKCGKNLPEGSKFCSGCGEKTMSEIKETPKVAQQTPPPVSQPVYSPPVQQPQQQTYSNPKQQAYSKPQLGMGALSVGDYIKMMLLMFIPIVNFVFLFIWAFGKEANMNKKNFAKATLILSAISIVLWLIMLGLMMGFSSSMY